MNSSGTGFGDSADSSFIRSHTRATCLRKFSHVAPAGQLREIVLSGVPSDASFGLDSVPLRCVQPLGNREKIANIRIQNLVKLLRGALAKTVLFNCVPSFLNAGKSVLFAEN
jgi:hypothetical protein